MRDFASDWIDKGWDIDGTITFSKGLQAAGRAAVRTSSSDVSPDQSIAIGLGYQIYFSDAVKRAVEIVVIAVGRITKLRYDEEEEIVAGGRADAVAPARAMLYDPRWPWHAAAESSATVEAPQYRCCQFHGMRYPFNHAEHDQR